MFLLTSMKSDTPRFTTPSWISWSVVHQVRLPTYNCHLNKIKVKELDQQDDVRFTGGKHTNLLPSGLLLLLLPWLSPLVQPLEDLYSTDVVT